MLLAHSERFELRVQNRANIYSRGVLDGVREPFNKGFLGGRLSCSFSSSQRFVVDPSGGMHLIRCIYTLIAICRELALVIHMITARQISAARALLGWSQQQLADKAIVSLNALARLEKGNVDSRVSTVAAVQKALTKAGIEFLIADQKGEGVRLKSPNVAGKRQLCSGFKCLMSPHSAPLRWQWLRTFSRILCSPTGCENGSSEQELDR
jgi:transcriptional regulator with XRE-family HTH domain